MARTFFRGGREGQPEDRHSRVEAESRPRRVSEIKWPPHRRQKLPLRFIPKESRFSVAILADTNVVAAASGTLDDPDVTGMEIATACPNGGSYSSIEIVLGYRHDLALVVSADGAPHKESERPLYKRPVRAEAAHRRHTPPQQRFHRQLRQRIAFVAYHRSWKHRMKLWAPVSFGFGTFVLSLFLLMSFSAAARNFQSFDQPRRVQSSRPEQTFGRHKRAPRSVQAHCRLPARGTSPDAKSHLETPLRRRRWHLHSRLAMIPKPALPFWRAKMSLPRKSRRSIPAFAGSSIR